ncbi:MAG: ubiquinol-cytochrome C chaperone family protein [Litorimonas sp.]
MGFLNRLFGRDDAATKDARRIYTKLMAQSRLPEFYADGGFTDSYDGRIDVLTLHIAAVLSNLNRYGENGERLGQALFDEMKDDFEIALREEALSDASVKKRIQPMISLFYDRVKKYAESLNQENAKAALDEVFAETLTIDEKNPSIGDDEPSLGGTISRYLLAFDENLSTATLGEIALTEFTFPALMD